MAYPYTDRPRPQNSTCIEVHEQSNKSAITATTLNLRTNVSLPYNSWKCTLAAWSTGNDVILSVKVRPWIDSAQTILGGALFFVLPGNVAAASVLTLAATGASTSRGAIGVIGAGAAGVATNSPFHDGMPLIHGLQVAVTSASAVTRGVVSWEFLGVPEA